MLHEVGERVEGEKAHADIERWRAMFAQATEESARWLGQRREIKQE